MKKYNQQGGLYIPLTNIKECEPCEGGHSHNCYARCLNKMGIDKKIIKHIIKYSYKRGVHSSVSKFILKKAFEDTYNIEIIVNETNINVSGKNLLSNSKFIEIIQQTPHNHAVMIFGHRHNSGHMFLIGKTLIYNNKIDSMIPSTILIDPQLYDKKIDKYNKYTLEKYLEEQKFIKYTISLIEYIDGSSIYIAGSNANSGLVIINSEMKIIHNIILYKIIIPIFKNTYALVYIIYIYNFFKVTNKLYNIYISQLILNYKEYDKIDIYIKNTFFSEFQPNIIPYLPYSETELKDLHEPWSNILIDLQNTLFKFTSKSHQLQIEEKATIGKQSLTFIQNRENGENVESPNSIYYSPIEQTKINNSSMSMSMSNYYSPNERKKKQKEKKNNK